MEQNKLFDGFIAAMVHDIGKIILDKDGRWGQHELINPKNNPFLIDTEIDFKKLLGEDIFDIAIKHGDPPEISAPNLQEAKVILKEKMDKNETNLEEIALMMADRLQKAMYLARKPTDPNLSKTMNNPRYIPYYGHDEQWEMGRSEAEVRRIANELSDPDGTTVLERVMKIQGNLLRFPHTTYIPHISLAIHHRFTTLLFYFIYPQLCNLPSPLDLKEVTLSTVQISPDPLSLLYRMKDVRIFKYAVKRLRDYLFKKVFVNEKIVGMKPTNNPFEFFQGDSLVLVYNAPEKITSASEFFQSDSLVLVYNAPEKIISASKEFVDQDNEVHSLRIDRKDYIIKEGWEIKNNKLSFYARPENVNVIPSTNTILSERLLQFLQTSSSRCNRCNMPVEESKEDEKGDILCPDCYKSRQEIKEKGIAIERVAQRDGEEERIAFIFLTFPEDIKTHAREVAEKIVREFEYRNVINPETIKLNKKGLFEFLQAVTDIKLFQDKIKKTMELLTKEKDAVHQLFSFPTCAAYLLREDIYWRFLNFLLVERKKMLALDTSLRVILCGPKFPFWNLMDKFTEYTPEDIYYDASWGGGITVFTADDINSIRSLAAKAGDVTNAQLSALIQAALKTNFEELLLEIEARGMERKLGHPKKESGIQFAGELRDALDRLGAKGDTLEDQGKRAVFIKYIKKLKGGK